MRRLSVSAVSNDQKRYAPVVPYPLFILLMALNFFTEKQNFCCLRLSS